MFKNFLFITVFTLFSFFSFSQGSKAIDPNWQFGLGIGLVKFSDKDVAYIGDKHLSQIPRLNATRRINDNFSLDAAISFGASDSGLDLVTTNNVLYFSFDVSGRYKYIKTIERLDPFIFIGGSIVDSERKMTPTANIGTGVSYWFSNNFGFSTQVYYKHSLESFESMRSHLQFTAGIIFGLNSGKSKRSKNGGTGCYYNQL